MVDAREIRVGTKLTFKDHTRAFGVDYSGKTMTVGTINVNATGQTIITLEEDEEDLHWYPKAFERIEYDVSLLDMFTKESSL